MTKIGIIMGSTRPNRHSPAVAQWVLVNANKRGDCSYELIDLLDFALPNVDEAIPPSMGIYNHEHTKAWAATVASFDGFVIVTPEYNHSVPGALKNALDFVYREWNNKAVGFVGYGALGAARAVEHLRVIAGELQMADVQAQVALSIANDFIDFTEFAPAETHRGSLNAMLDQLVAWSSALSTLRPAKVN